MNLKIILGAVCLSGAIYCQTPTLSDPTPRAAVRRISAGLTLTVLGIKPFPSSRTTTTVTSTPALDALYTTTGNSRRVGYGVTAQIAITDRISINGDLLMRRVAYLTNSDVYEGTDNPNTSTDERRYTIRNEDTRARFYDLPITVRFYGKDRFERGPRWFAEAGPAWRRVSRIRTSIRTQVNFGNVECCDTTPAIPSKRTVRGFVAGFGVHAVDPVGIRVVPLVRYTRWMGESFNALSTLTQRNQIEAMISLTF